MVDNTPEHEKIRREREDAQKEKERLEREEQQRLDDENR